MCIWVVILKVCTHFSRVQTPTRKIQTGKFNGTLCLLSCVFGIHIYIYSVDCLPALFALFFKVFFSVYLFVVCRLFSNIFDVIHVSGNSFFYKFMLMRMINGLIYSYEFIICLLCSTKTAFICGHFLWFFHRDRLQPFEITVKLCLTASPLTASTINSTGIFDQKFQNHRKKTEIDF